MGLVQLEHELAQPHRDLPAQCVPRESLLARRRRSVSGIPPRLSVVRPAALLSPARRKAAIPSADRGPSTEWWAPAIPAWHARRQSAAEPPRTSDDSARAEQTVASRNSRQSSRTADHLARSQKARHASRAGHAAAEHATGARLSLD